MLKEPYQSRVLAWIKALESGDFKQTAAQLRNLSGHCCLGVGCEKSNVGEWSLKYGNYYYGDNLVDLPDNVQDFYGFVTTAGTFYRRDVKHDLSSLNDEGVSFS